jgi:5-oxopent-3-ene-1,2,5-tricarboxylate decarboxylase / 2-hydroxyhepta-2,4-diene-1,7-dioate isomerase
MSASPHFDAPPYRLSGTVLGCLMNHRPALAALADAVSAAPYKAAPKAPVLYVKPRNTLAGDGSAVAVPCGEGEPGEVEVGAALGLVIGRTAHRVSAGDALAHVAGAIVVNDVSLPHASYYRPSVRLKARDGFCPLGARVAPLPANVDALGVRVFIDEKLVHETSTGDRVRSAAQLIADVSEFMTLQPGDVLMLGVSHGAPRARAGQTSRIEIDGVGHLTNTYVIEAVEAAR